MSNLRFGHFFALLMVLAAFSAFIIPPRYTNPTRAEFQGLFSPISRPTRSLSGFVYRRLHHEAQVDLGSPNAVRSDESLLTENQQLRLSLAAVTEKLELLNQVDQDRAMIGEVRALCKPATVTGSDVSGIHQSLTLSGAFTSGFAADMPVIHPRGLVGRITLAGLGSAHVRLITDKGFSIRCRLSLIRTDADGKTQVKFINTLHPIVYGQGNNYMSIQNAVSMEQVKEFGLGLNDTLVLDDPDYPPDLQGELVGRITNIVEQRNAPLFADIRVEPIGNLMQLREVMVMVKK